jgi:hypothetical protein
MDIHVGMMLKFPVNDLLGWIVDDTPIFEKAPGIPDHLVMYRVQWANGATTQEVLINIQRLRNNWLELEINHERLSNKDTDR